MPALKGETHDRGAMFWHYPHYGNQGGSPSGAVREGDWKLIEFYEDGRLELYNLKSDLGEKKNLADAEPARRDALAAEAARLAEGDGRSDAGKEGIAADHPRNDAGSARRRARGRSAETCFRGSCT